MFHRVVYVADGSRCVPCVMTLPSSAEALVVVAGTSGSQSRLESRLIASHFGLAGLGTLVADLLSPEEETYDPATRGSRSMNDLLSFRILRVTSWLRTEPSTRRLRLGVCGHEMTGAAALAAAVTRPGIVEAVLCISGRPDLLGADLARVRFATLFAVSEDDPWLVDRNRWAFERLRCEKRLVILSAETDPTEPLGTLHEAAELGAEWFSNIFTAVVA